MIFPTQVGRPLSPAIPRADWSRAFLASTAPKAADLFEGEKELRSERFQLDKAHRALHREFPSRMNRAAIEKAHARLLDLNRAIEGFIEVHNQLREAALRQVYAGPISEVHLAYFLSSDVRPDEMARVLRIGRELEAGTSPLITRKNTAVPLTGDAIWKTKMDLLDEVIHRPAAEGKPVEIDLEYYELTSPMMIQKLRTALQRGVKVRILMDPGKLERNGEAFDASSLAGRMRTVGLLTKGMSKADLGIAFFPNAKLLRKDAIMHRKIFRAGNAVIFGGMNGNTGSGEDVDMALLLHGEAASRLVEIFREDMDLSANATRRDTYGTQVQEIRRNPNILLNREGLMNLLETLVSVPVKEGESWQTRLDRVTKTARLSGITIDNLAAVSPEEMRNMAPDAPPVALTATGRKALAGKLAEAAQFLRTNENQEAMADIRTPAEIVSGSARIAIGDKPEERQALMLFGIATAEKFIKMPAFVLTKDIASALIARKEAMERDGKDFRVEITLDPGFYEPANFNPNEKTFIRLQGMGIPVKWIVLERSTNDHDRKLHAKMLLTDKLVITGSNNFSAKGLRRNWELTGAWIFDEADKPHREKLEQYFDRLYTEESLAPDIRWMAEQRFMNYGKPDKSLAMEEYALRKVRHFLYDIKAFEEQTGRWMEAFQRNPANRRKIDALVDRGYHRGSATFRVAGEECVRLVRTGAPAWKKMQRYWTFA